MSTIRRAERLPERGRASQSPTRIVVETVRVGEISVRENGTRIDAARDRDHDFYATEAERQRTDERTEFGDHHQAPLSDDRTRRRRRQGSVDRDVLRASELRDAESRGADVEK